MPALRYTEAAGNTSDLNVGQQLLGKAGSGNCFPKVPLPEVPLPKLTRLELPLSELPLPKLPLPKLRLPKLPLHELPLILVLPDSLVGQ